MKLLRGTLIASTMLAANGAGAVEPDTLKIGGQGTCQLNAKPVQEKPGCFEWALTSTCPGSNAVAAYNRDTCDKTGCQRTSRLSAVRDKELFVCGPRDGKFFIVSDPNKRPTMPGSKPAKP